MNQNWPREQLFAVTVDGKVLMNAQALDDADLATLATRRDVFVGVILQADEVRRLRRAIRDATSEAAASISGARRTKARPRRRKRKT
jgi:hypothetical protein